MLHIRDLSKSLGGVDVLKGLSLDIAEGALFGLVGANGSGKSTLLNLIGGQIAPDAGTIQLDGAQIARLSPARRAAMGIARTFQDSRLWPALSIGQHFSILPALARCSRAQWLAAVDAMLELVELPRGLLERFPRHLTLDERRKLELALAALGRPRLLLVDEIGAGLDPNRARGLYGTIARLVATGQVKAAILVEHKLNVLSSVATEIGLLEDGSITKRAPSHRPDEVEDIFSQLLSGGRVRRSERCHGTSATFA